MFAMIYKDLVSAKLTYLAGVVLGLAIAIYGVNSGYYAALPAVLCYLPIIFNGVSFGNEAQSTFQKFAFTSPISRLSYVVSKYFFGMVFAVLAFVVTIIMLGSLDVASDLAFLAASVALAFPLVMSSIQLLAILKFGPNSGQYVMVVFYFLLFAGTSMFKDIVGWVLKVISGASDTNLYMVGALIIAVSLLGLAISICLSRLVVTKKEY